MQIHPGHDLGDEIILAAVIPPTENSQYHYINFCNTFLGGEEKDIQQALHRWGSVYIYPTQFGKTHYSVIKWVYQPHHIKMTVAEIYRQEREISQEQQQRELDSATF